MIWLNATVEPVAVEFATIATPVPAVAAQLPMVLMAFTRVPSKFPPLPPHTGRVAFASCTLQLTAIPFGLRPVASQFTAVPHGLPTIMAHFPAVLPEFGIRPALLGLCRKRGEREQHSHNEQTGHPHYGILG